MVSQNVVCVKLLDASHYVPVRGQNKKKYISINMTQHAAPPRASKTKHAWKVKRENVGITSLTRDEALAFVNTELSKHQDQLATLGEG